MRRIVLLLYMLMLGFVSFSQSPTYPSSLTVSQDGTGNYRTIQEAVNSIRDLGEQEVKIFIKKGIYREKLVIPSWKTHLSLIGESRDSTIITNDDFTGKVFPGKDPSGRDKFMTFTTYTVLVQGNDFSAENLTIRNTAGRVGQAVALHVEGDRVLIKNCNLLGNQDTLYTATSQSRQYYIDCYIEGTTDFIFGEATVVFRRCTIRSLTNSFVTAAATTRHQPFGYVFMECKMVADSSVDQVYLGRPWRPFAKTVFLRCELGKHILPQGWDRWNGDAMFPAKEKTAFYAEYQNKGAGSTNTQRVAWSKQLTAKEAAAYTVPRIFAGDDHWNPPIN